MIVSLLVVAAVWFSLVVIGNQLLHIRAHAILGQEFLSHSNTVFVEHGKTELSDLLTERMIPQIRSIRYRVSNKFFWTLVSMAFVLMLMATVVANSSVWFIDAGAGIGVAYVIVSLLSAYKDRELIDSICEACNEDLIKIDHPNEINVVLNNLPNDPPNDSMDG